MVCIKGKSLALMLKCPLLLLVHANFLLLSFLPINAAALKAVEIYDSSEQAGLFGVLIK